MSFRPTSDAPAAVVADLDARARRVRTPCGAGSMVWRIWGAGPPLVLLHGASGSWTHWLLNIDALAAQFRVLAPDMPGFGDSADAPDPQTADTLADVVSAGLDVVVPPPATIDLAGFSFGGIVGGLVAARRGRRVRTLVLVGPNGLALPSGETPRLARVTAGMSPADVREAHRGNLRILMLADPARADDLAVHLQIENLRRARFRSTGIPESDVLLRALPRVTARIVGVWGERDAFSVPYLEERRDVLARFQPDLEFHVVPGAGHWVPYEAPAAVSATLVETLAQRSPAG